MKRHLLVICIIILFLISALIPITLGHDIKDSEVKQLKPIKFSNGTPPEEEWNKTFGGYNIDHGHSVSQTTDGGYIITGGTSSFGTGGPNVWLIKTDSNGNNIWNKAFSDINYDYGYSVSQTSDGGYIITGVNFPLVGYANVWLIKTDSNGNKMWDKIFGGTEFDGGHSVSQTSDGGYIITGYTYSYGAGSADVWLIKTDSNGIKIWDKTFGGTEYDGGMLVTQTGDGGYIIIGATESYGAGMEDVWLIKTGSNGNKIWDKTFGGTSDDFGWEISQTSDEGYILIGVTESYGAGMEDVWLIKTNSNGNKIWDKTFGGTSDDGGYSVSQTNDGGYIITGSTGSFDVGGWDVWLIKTGSNGNKVWDKTFGGNKTDEGRSVQQTTDGGYIITGWTDSFGAGKDDVWLIKVRRENQPPSKPTITGPNSGKPDTEYDFTFVSTDPEGDAVMYNIDWGDDNTEWTEYGDSGVEITLKHTWTSQETFTIKAQAVDLYGAEKRLGRVSDNYTTKQSNQQSIPKLLTESS